MPSIPIAYFYAYNSNFAQWTYDATLVIAITFLGSAVSAAILPWRKPEIYNASPIARYKVLGLPLIQGFKYAGDGVWSDGQIYDPKSGKSYRSTLALNPDGSLKVSGCVLFICESRRWTRAR